VDELVDLVLTVSALTTLDEVDGLLALETTVGVGESKWPQEVVDLLEVGANSEDLVDNIFHTDDSVLSEGSLNDRVVVDGDSLTVDLGVSTLVDKLTGGLQVGVTPGNVWGDPLEHLEGSLVELNESSGVDLGETEQLEDLSWLGGKLVDTLDTDNESKSGLSWDVEGVVGLGGTTETDLVSLLSTVLLDVLLSRLEDNLTLGLVVLLGRGSLGSAVSVDLLESLSLLEDGLWDSGLAGWGNGASFSVRKE